MEYKTLNLSISNKIATICLSRPKSLNSIDHNSASDLRDAVGEIVSNNNVNVVVISGSDNVFSEGSSLDGVSIKTDENIESISATLASLRVANTISELNVPVIAAINGSAMNHGLELALACDLRFTCPKAKFGFTDIKKGIIPWDGGTQRLPRTVGRSKALELLITGKQIDAKEAYAAGLVNSVVSMNQLSSTVQEMASEIATHGPVALKYLKEAIYKGMDLTFEQGLRLEYDLYCILQDTDDRKEGINSFLERRKPQFKGS